MISPSFTLKSLETKTTFEKSTEKFQPPPMARTKVKLASRRRRRKKI
jgi:hypothetical protein